MEPLRLNNKLHVNLPNVETPGKLQGHPGSSNESLSLDGRKAKMAADKTNFFVKDHIDSHSSHVNSEHAHHFMDQKLTNVNSNHSMPILSNVKEVIKYDKPKLDNLINIQFKNGNTDAAPLKDIKDTKKLNKIENKVNTKGHENNQREGVALIDDNHNVHLTPALAGNLQPGQKTIWIMGREYNVIIMSDEEANQFNKAVGSYIVQLQANIKGGDDKEDDDKKGTIKNSSRTRSSPLVHNVNSSNEKKHQVRPIMVSSGGFKETERILEKIKAKKEADYENKILDVKAEKLNTLIKHETLVSDNLKFDLNKSQNEFDFTQNHSFSIMKSSAPASAA